jgi:hypothetical protein
MSHVDVVLSHIRRLPQSSNAVPRLSFENGIAGVAYAAHLLARSSCRHELNVAAVDLMDRTRRFIDTPEAFHLEYPNQALARHVDDSVLHGPIGYWLVTALTSLGNSRSSSHRATETYLETATKAYQMEEYAFGSAGALWGCSLLLRTNVAERLRKRIESAGRHLLEATWESWRGNLAAARGGGRIDSLGFAHGRAGVLYAVLAFCRDSGIALPVCFREELEDLAGLAEVTSRGVSWPSTFQAPGTSERWPGERESWCNGAAGFVPLWHLAFEVFGQTIYRELALKTAAYLVRRTNAVSASLCCGLAGHAIAMQYAESLEPGKRWAQFRNDSLVACGIESLPLNEETHGLFKGAFGVLLAGEPWL